MGIERKLKLNHGHDPSMRKRDEHSFGLGPSRLVHSCDSVGTFSAILAVPPTLTRASERAVLEASERALKLVAPDRARRTGDFS